MSEVPLYGPRAAGGLGKHKLTSVDLSFFFACRSSLVLGVCDGGFGAPNLDVYYRQEATGLERLVG